MVNKCGTTKKLHICSKVCMIFFTLPKRAFRVFGGLFRVSFPILAVGSRCFSWRCHCSPTISHAGHRMPTPPEARLRADCDLGLSIEALLLEGGTKNAEKHRSVEHRIEKMNHEAENEVRHLKKNILNFSCGVSMSLSIICFKTLTQLFISSPWSRHNGLAPRHIARNRSQVASGSRLALRSC